jgi:hypothetical protein
LRVGTAGFFTFETPDGRPDTPDGTFLIGDGVDHN